VGGRCRDLCFENGLVMRAVRDAMVVSPPLTITHEEIGELVARARRAIDQTAKELGML
jgi:putrescine aminotransferase